MAQKALRLQQLTSARLLISLLKRFTIMLSGFKGVKYGLTVPRKEAKPGVKKPLAVFADGDSDEDEQSKVARDIERQAQRKQSNAKVLFACSSFAELTGGLQQSNLSYFTTG